MSLRRMRSSMSSRPPAALNPTVLNVEAMESDDEAIKRANASPYGLACSACTAMVGRFDRMAEDLDVGIRNGIRGAVGRSSRLPSGGVRNAGNHRSAGLFSGFHRIDPASEIRLATPPAGPSPP